MGIIPIKTNAHRFKKGLALLEKAMGIALGR